MRGAPHNGFSALIRLIKARSSRRRAAGRYGRATSNANSNGSQHGAIEPAPRPAKLPSRCRDMTATFFSAPQGRSGATWKKRRDDRQPVCTENAVRFDSVTIARLPFFRRPGNSGLAGGVRSQDRTLLQGEFPVMQGKYREFLRNRGGFANAPDALVPTSDADVSFLTWKIVRGNRRQSTTAGIVAAPFRSLCPGLSSTGATEPDAQGRAGCL